jgi:hypothetical protein
MAFRTNSLAQTYRDVQSQAWRLKAYLSGKISEINDTPTSTHKLLEILATLRQARQLLDNAAATPGLAAYAINEQDDAGYDIAAEYTTLRAAIQDAIAWMATNFPRNSAGTFILVDSMDADGDVTPHYFMLADLGDLPTRLQAVADLIE